MIRSSSLFVAGHNPCDFSRDFKFKGQRGPSKVKGNKDGNYIPPLIQHPVLFGRVMDVQSSRRERRLFDDDLLIVAGLVPGKYLMMYRIGPGNEILEDVDGMRMVGVVLQDLPVSSVKLAALDAVQFGVTAVDSV